MKPKITSMAGKSFKEVELFMRNWLKMDNSKSWLTNAPEICNHDNWNLSLLEIADEIEGALIWSKKNNEEISVAVFAISNNAIEAGLGVELLKRGILKWAELKISKACLTLPETDAKKLMGTLKSCGFVFESLSWTARADKDNSIRFCKKFVYEMAPQTEILSFLERLFTMWGYETKMETDNLLYRSRPIFQNPFLFPSWHRINRQQTKLIVTPPARPLEAIELETLLFPLVIKGSQEKPLLVTIDKKRASAMIDLPPPRDKTEIFFGQGSPESHQLNRGLVYTFPSGFQEIRPGLPALFYVNSIGAVGEARIESWSFEDPRNLCKALYND
ncbi:MAG: hypothetical protein ACP5VS_13385, partial [Desulfomonilaceae bacterium]